MKPREACLPFVLSANYFLQPIPLMNTCKFERSGRQLTTCTTLVFPKVFDGKSF